MFEYKLPTHTFYYLGNTFRTAVPLNKLQLLPAYQYRTPHELSTSTWKLSKGASLSRIRIKTSAGSSGTWPPHASRGLLGSSA